jgi:hypothetical protein
MAAGNLSVEQRKWILKQYWKTENAERVHIAWVEVFNVAFCNVDGGHFEHLRD